MSSSNTMQEIHEKDVNIPEISQPAIEYLTSLKCTFEPLDPNFDYSVLPKHLETLKYTFE